MYHCFLSELSKLKKRTVSWVQIYFLYVGWSKSKFAIISKNQESSQFMETFFKAWDEFMYHSVEVQAVQFLKICATPPSELGIRRRQVRRVGRMVRNKPFQIIQKSFGLRYNKSRYHESRWHHDWTSLGACFFMADCLNKSYWSPVKVFFFLGTFDRYS